MEDRECKRLGNIYNDEKFTGGEYGGNVWDSNQIAPTMKTGASASQQCTVEISKQASKQGYPYQTSNERRLDTDGCTRDMRSELPRFTDKERKSARERSSKSNADNGEYP